MDRIQQVVASLEGMRLIVSDGWCELDEYDFTADFWAAKARSRWPMERTEAEGWNAVDRFAAMNRLVAPVAGS